MKKNLLVYVLLMWIFAACAPQPQPTQQSLLPNDDSYPNSYPNGNNPSPLPPLNLTPAQTAAVSALSNTLNLPPGQITVISTEAVEWSDGCLGVQKIGVLCTQATVPGYKIVLQANGTSYEFHTNKDGKQIVPVGEVAATGAVEEMVIKQLASNLGLKESDVSVISTAEVEFGDACLDVAVNNVMCAQVVTPGQIIVLEANGLQYEYHVTNDGSNIQPATLALTWTRDGGIAGFCDSLTVFLSGEVEGNQCHSNPNPASGTVARLLSTGQWSQFDAWIKELGTVNVNASDPEGVSDRMVVTLTLYGTGNGKLNKADQQELLLWVQDLYQKLYN